MWKALFATALTTTLLLAATPVEGQSRNGAVGADGEIYLVQTGAYGQLFPDGGWTEPDHDVLALDVARPDHSAQRQRLLVPETESPDVEHDPSVLFEDGAETLYLLWQTKIHGIHSSLNFTSYKDGTWSEVVEIWGSSYGWKVSPQLAVTWDTFQTVEADGSLQTRTRAITHVIWGEERGAGLQIFYTPIILIDGEFIGWSPVYRLDDLVDLPAGGVPPSEGTGVTIAPRIVTGDDSGTVVVAFETVDGEEVASLRLEMLPGQISVLADKVSAQIIEIGHTSPRPPLSRLADRVSAQIIEIGHRIGIHPGLSTYTAEQVLSELGSVEPGQDLSVLADKVSAQIIEIGARMDGHGLDRGGVMARSRTLNIPVGEAYDPLANLGSIPPNLLRVETVAVHPVPEAGLSETTLHVSPSGDHLALSWNSEDELVYRESGESGWGPPHAISLRDGVMSLEQARELLRERTRSRRDIPATR